MLTGSTIIELTDVNSGQKQTYTDDNMVTNALTEFFRPLGLAKSPALFYSSFAPYHETLLGGLLLFDSKIDENPSNFFAPANAKTVATGVFGQLNSTVSTLRGNYNSMESEYNESSGYMKYVYDFDTSHGNGTINSVCLTHANSGYDGYGGHDDGTNTTSQMVQVCNGYLQYTRSSGTGATTSCQYGGYTVGITEMLFLVSRSEDVCYYLRIDSATQVSITKRKAYLKNVSVLENPSTTKPLVSDVAVTLEEDLVSTTNVHYNFDVSSDCLYIFAASTTTTAAGGTFQVIKIKIPTLEVTYYTATNTTGVTIGTSRSARFAFAYNGYVLVKASSSPYTVYKMEIDNWANLSAFSYTDSTVLNSYPAFAINNRVYYRSSAAGQMAIADLETGEILRPRCNGAYGNYNGTYHPVWNEPLLYFFSLASNYAGSFTVPTNYLATINNLSESVTKTADKTMKVTYIIQKQE